MIALALIFREFLVAIKIGKRARQVIATAGALPTIQGHATFVAQVSPLPRAVARRRQPARDRTFFLDGHPLGTRF